MAACTNGHVNAPGVSFCTTCGLALVSEQPSAPVQDVPIVQAPGLAPLPGPRRSRPWVLPTILVSIIALVGLGVLAYQALKPKTTTVTVTMDLYNGTDSCDVGLGYNDIPGAAVVVSADGVPVGFGTLDYFGTDMGLYCEFKATITSVPTDKSLYSLTIGGDNRGELTSTQSELSANGWEWGVTLGG